MAQCYEFGLVFCVFFKGQAFQFGVTEVQEGFPTGDALLMNPSGSLLLLELTSRILCGDGEKVSQILVPHPLRPKLQFCGKICNKFVTGFAKRCDRFSPFTKYDICISRLRMIPTNMLQSLT